MRVQPRLHWVVDEGLRVPRFPRSAVRTLFAAALDEAGLRGRVEICIRFVNDDQAADLHGQHFGDPTTTDVMTFPDGSQDPASAALLLGDLAVCVDVARREAAARKRPVAHELVLYILHGMLHLLDYDDAKPADRARMWAAQRRLLATVGIGLEADPT